MVLPLLLHACYIFWVFSPVSDVLALLSQLLGVYVQHPLLLLPKVEGKLAPPDVHPAIILAALLLPVGEQQQQQGT